MFNYIKIKDRRAFLCVLFLLIVTVVFATYVSCDFIVEIAKVCIVISFVVFYKKANLHYSFLFRCIITFILLNIIIRLLPQVENALALIFNVTAYILLAYYPIVTITKFKLKDITDVSFLIIMIIDCVIAILFYKVVALRIESFMYFILVAIHIVVILCLSFSAFAVFIQNGKRKSLIFVFMVLAFLFSDIMFALNAFYSENILLVLGDELLNVTAWYFMFSFFYEKQYEVSIAEINSD